MHLRNQSRAGVFDEDLHIYYEDVDLAFRAQLAGYNGLYVPEAVAYHHHGASASRFGRSDYFLARNVCGAHQRQAKGGAW